MIDLGIVILNWNTRDYLRRSLQTVLASEGEFSYRVIVVDNASSDDSADMVRREFPQVELIVSPVNGGYPYGNNLGLRALGYRAAGNVAADSPRYALLLNPDTEVPPNGLYNMVKFMDSRPEVGVAGPKLVLLDGSLDKACRRGFPTIAVSAYHFLGLAKLFPKSPRFGRYNMTFAHPDDELEVDSVVGAYMQVRRECIERVGLLDEAFFMYGEDLDWAFRIKHAGWKVVYHPGVIVRHVKKAASRQSKRAQFEFWRAMLIFYRKHYRASTPLWLHSLVMLGLLAKGGRRLWSEIRQPAPPMSSASAQL
jgi:GT2 family glycosyltransferase